MVHCQPSLSLPPEPLPRRKTTTTTQYTLHFIFAVRCGQIEKVSAITYAQRQRKPLKCNANRTAHTGPRIRDRRLSRGCNRQDEYIIERLAVSKWVSASCFAGRKFAPIKCTRDTVQNLLHYSAAYALTTFSFRFCGWRQRLTIPI